MQIEEYGNIFSQEETHWWYQSNRDLVHRLLNQFSPVRGQEAVILDAGCGTGGMLRSLKNATPGLGLVGVDYSRVALGYCGIEFSVSQATVESLPFKNESVDVVICLDVLYHQNIGSDLSALKEMNRVLKRRGCLLIHLPAFEFLRGAHDKVVRTRERYTVKILNDRMRSAGFKIVRSGYRNMLLFHIIFIKRAMENIFYRSGAGSDLKPLPSLLNNIVKKLSFLENRIAGRIYLPYGSSVFCLAQKP